MATVSSHTLNAVDGTHAGGIKVHLDRLDPAGDRATLFATATDEGGRLSETLTLGPQDGNAFYELVFQTGDYFETLPRSEAAPQICQEVVIRFSMPDPEGRYHIPVILSPNGYSVWWSS